MAILFEQPLYLFGYRFEIDPYVEDTQKGFWIDRYDDDPLTVYGFHFFMLYVRAESEQRIAEWRQARRKSEGT